VAGILDGKAVAATIRAEVAEGVTELRERGIPVRLDVVLVGDDPASATYVRMKQRDCAEVGIESLALISSIDPAKDVDGLSPLSVGRLAVGLPSLLPCTPHGVVQLLRRSGVEIEGREAVVIGRSNLVGKPLVQLLLRENATVTVCHSRTRDLPEVARRANLLIVAAGRREFVGAEYVREGAVVVDVGIHTREEGGLVGDVRFDEVEPRASRISPVPGGVGPMTRAMLLYNTLQAARAVGGLAG